jgi:hypothetical protein
MVSALVLHSVDYSVLSDLAQRHARSDRDISPHLYPLWLDSLIFAAKTCDRFFNDKIEASWRQAMQPGIDYLISFY